MLMTLYCVCLGFCSPVYSLLSNKPTQYNINFLNLPCGYLSSVYITLFIQNYSGTSVKMASVNFVPYQDPENFLPAESEKTLGAAPRSM